MAEPFPDGHPFKALDDHFQACADQGRLLPLSDFGIELRPRADIPGAFDIYGPAYLGTIQQRAPSELASDRRRERKRLREAQRAARRRGRRT